MNPLAAAALGVGLFASTNVDDLFVLVAWFASGHPSRDQVVVGQYVGFAIIVVGSIAAAVAVGSLAHEAVRLLGLIPIGMAAVKLRNLRSTRNGRREGRQHPASGIIEVATITLAGCGDNLAVYTPAFAGRDVPTLAVLGFVFVVMTAVWCYAAYRLATHPDAGAPLRRYADFVVPVVLIAVGLVVLSGA